MSGPLRAGPAENRRLVSIFQPATEAKIGLLADFREIAIFAKTFVRSSRLIIEKIDEKVKTFVRSRRQIKEV